MQVKDFPKIESPFIRNLDDNDNYLVTPVIAEGYQWVLEDDETLVLATEKLDGTDVSLIIENGVIKEVWNRLNFIPFFNKGKMYIIEGVINAYKKGYCDLKDGQYFGEVIGPLVNGNPYRLTEHIWIPFLTYTREHLVYKSWHKYEKSFENLKKWFFAPLDQGGIFSLYMRKKGILAKPEGIVFHNLKTGQMAKLRLDMFKEWTGKRHRDEFSKKKK
jgi:hypothetical protein